MLTDYFSSYKLTSKAPFDEEKKNLPKLKDCQTNVLQDLHIGVHLVHIEKKGSFIFNLHHIILGGKLARIILVQRLHTVSIIMHAEYRWSLKHRNPAKGQKVKGILNERQC